MPRKNNFPKPTSRPKDVQLKELSKALKSAQSSRAEVDIPEDDVYWKVKLSLNR